MPVIGARDGDDVNRACDVYGTIPSAPSHYTRVQMRCHDTRPAQKGTAKRKTGAYKQRCCVQQYAARKRYAARPRCVARAERKTPIFCSMLPRQTMVRMQMSRQATGNSHASPSGHRTAYHQIHCLTQKHSTIFEPTLSPARLPPAKSRWCALFQICAVGVAVTGPFAYFDIINILVFSFVHIFIFAFIFHYPPLIFIPPPSSVHSLF